jgi:hypothetical protein
LLEVTSGQVALETPSCDAREMTRSLWAAFLLAHSYAALWIVLSAAVVLLNKWIVVYYGKERKFSRDLL